MERQRRAVLLRLLFVTACAVATTAAADNASSSKAERAKPGWEEEIKGRRDRNALNALSEAPPDKGGRKSRQAMCRLRVDNRTPWMVQIGVDGRYNGTIAAWGDAFGAYTGGTLRLFGVAEFDDGSAQAWGPATIKCLGTYTWTLQQ